MMCKMYVYVCLLSLLINVYFSILFNFFDRECQRRFQLVFDRCRDSVQRFSKSTSSVSAWMMCVCVCKMYVIGCGDGLL